MIKIVIPDSKYKNAFIDAVVKMKNNSEGFISPSVQQFLDYDLEKLTNNFENYIVKPYIDTMNGINLPEGFVPSTEYWILDEQNTFVGRIALRHKLNEFMEQYIGHLGYMIVPTERKKGYATEAVDLTIAEAKEMGIKELIILCESTNDVSKSFLEKLCKKYCGKQIESTSKKEITFLRWKYNLLY